VRRALSLHALLTVYIECTRVSAPSSELGPLPPQARVSPPRNQRGDVRGGGDPIRTIGKKAWHSVYSVNDMLNSRASCVSDVLYNVKYSLEGGSLQLELSGAVTAPTPVNLVNHVYFNLAGHKAGADGTLWRDMHIYIYYVSSRIVD
jgi:hypothetical protein